MNLYALIILTALILSWILELITDQLNLTALSPHPPPEFAGLINAQTYAKSQQYTRKKTQLGLLSSTMHFILLMSFWLMGGFGWLDQITRNLGHGPIITGLMFIIALLVAQWLASLPFSLYTTFVLEERYGFNRKTWQLYLADTGKGLLLALLLGVPLLAGLLAFLQSAGEQAWLYCWGSVTLFILIIQYVAPRWIMPLFNRFDPLPEGELKEALAAYAAKVDFPLAGVYRIDGSKRSSKANAFFTGFGKNRRVALYDTLIDKHTIPELVAILAHEIGHYKLRHIQQGLLIGILHLGGLFFLLSIFLTHEGLFAAFDVTTPSIHAGLVFFGLLFTPVDQFLSTLMHLLSRRNEYAADRFAATTTGDPTPLMTALRKLSVSNLSNLTPHPLHVFLNHSHPPVVERLRALGKLS